MIIEYAKRCEKSMMVSTIVMLILGIILAIEPTASIRMITTIIAIVFMLIGGFQLVDYIRKPRQDKMMSLSLILGVILLAVGLFLFINTDSLVKFITVLIGITIAIKALFKIQFSLNIRDISDKWRYNLVIGLIEMTLGVILLLNPFNSAVIFLRIVGILLIVGSIVELVETGLVLKTLDNVTEDKILEKDKK